MALITAGRNPLYLILIWLALQIVYALWLDPGREHLLVFSPLRLSLFIIITSAVFNALTSHFGETVLWVVPGNIPLISGPITLEALIYGALNGLVLSNILTAFMVLNLALPTQALVRLVPKTYYALAIVISIAVAFLPSTRRQLELVREAQAIRGRRISGFKDYLALFMPVLVGGLERAVQLAETMTARGFVSGAAEQKSDRYRLAMLLGLVLILAGWIVQWDLRWRVAGELLLPVGGLIVVGSLWAVGHRTQRTSYRKERWGWLDLLAFLVVVGALLISFDQIPGLDYASLYYTPYPSIHIPRFDPRIGLAIITLLLPVLARFQETA